MKITPRLLLLATALAAPLLVLAASATDAGNPKSYAVRIPVTLAPDAPLQRLLVPAEALVRLQSASYADLRLFNAAGQPVPMGLANVAVQTATQEQQVKLTAYPILGPTNAVDLDSVSLRIEERQGQREVQLNVGGSASTTVGATGAALPQKIWGVLLDTRTVSVPAARMTLDADLPIGQPVSFYVQASKDLKNWRSLADTVLYRADASMLPASLGNNSLSLSMADLKEHYLRVTWGDAAVTVRGATLVTSSSMAMRERVSATIAAPVLTHPHELTFALPFATPVTALKITPQGSNILVPIRVLGRNDRSQSWSLLASAVVYRMTAAGKEQTSGPIELQGSSVREIKIEANLKTPGFDAVPEIVLQFEPAQLIFLASGQGPFTLAAGLPSSTAATGSFLPMASLIPDYKAQQENSLPVAQAVVTKTDIGGSGISAFSPLVTVQPSSEGTPTRSLVLWAILLVGALALGLMAWVLLKQTRQAPRQD